MFQRCLVDSRREGCVVEESDVVCAVQSGEIGAVATAALDVSPIDLPAGIEESGTRLCKFTGDCPGQSIKETIHCVETRT